jgi:signal transduction histidine kinase
VTGTFLATAADLYGPHWFVRIHVLAESLLAPAFFHLAVVFPTERLPHHRRRLLVLCYLVFAAFGVTYEVLLDSPSAYTALHLAASATHGIGAAAIIVGVAWAFLRSPSALVRRRVGVVALGTFAAFVIPGVLMAASGFLGGTVPINAGIFTAFLFPVSLGYAIVQQDLFEIDVMLRRAATYGIVVVLIAALYFAALSLLAFLLPSSILQSPLTLAAMNLVLLFLIFPATARVQDAVDRVFFRKAYDAERALAFLSERLAGAHTVDEVVARLHGILAETACPVSAALFLHEPTRTFRRVGDGDDLALDEDLTMRLRRGNVLARYEWDDGSGRPLPAVWNALQAEVLIPVGYRGWLVAVIALGVKGSGHRYTVHDIEFLRAAASQLALALTNADAFARLEALNASLEAQVRERTASLEKANQYLAHSLEELQAASEHVERNQASLVRAERLATLGRLTAGIAHEVNTPLGAVINSLRILGDLSREYAESIDDPSVTTDDHREIARELLGTTEAAGGWARKAAAFINKVRMHGSDAAVAARETFTIATVLVEVQALLAHRVRASACKLEMEHGTDVAATGNPSQLVQVLVNLVTNAIDAYEDVGIFDGRIAVVARRDGDRVLVTVRDWAGGIPANVLPHIFDELFTTKDPGRGTGLGLWIARNLIEQSFGGTLTVEVEAGVGSVFVIALPASAAEHGAASAA